MLLLRIERRQVLEEHLLARPFGRLEVDRFDLDQREVPLAVLRRPDLARTPCRRCAGRTCGSATARRRCRRGPAGSCSRAPAGTRSRRAASRARPSEKIRPLFSARAFRISKISSCLRMPVAPGTSSCLAIFVSAPTLMSLSVARSMRSIFSGGRGAVAFGGRGCGCCGCCGCGLRLFASLSISFHSSSSPSPVTAETGSTESSNTDSSSLSARIRWPRASLSILVATTRAAFDRRLQPLPGLEVARQPRMPGVHEQRAPRSSCRCDGAGSTGALAAVAIRLRRAPAEVRSRQLFELAGRPDAASRISVTRQIDEVERRRGAARDPVDVRQPRLARARRSSAPRAAGRAR